MQRLRRTIRLLYLLLLVGVIGLWVRSHWYNDAINYRPAPLSREGRIYSIRSGRGGFCAWIIFRDLPRTGPYMFEYGRQRAYWYPMQSDKRQGPLNFTRWNALGFERKDFKGFVSFTLPYWALTLPLMMLPATWMYLWWKRRRRRQAGRCGSCGYDLRASRGRCPECGTLIPLPHISRIGDN